MNLNFIIISNIADQKFHMQCIHMPFSTNQMIPKTSQEIRRYRMKTTDNEIIIWPN